MQIEERQALVARQDIFWFILQASRQHKKIDEAKRPLLAAMPR